MTKALAFVRSVRFVGLCIVLICFFLPYTRIDMYVESRFWWGSLGIALGAFLMFSRQWPTWLGLKMSSSDLLFSIGLLTLGLMATYNLIPYLISQTTITVQLSSTPVLDGFLQFPQVLNEEIIFRGLGLSLLFRLLPNRKLLCIVSMAAVFSIAHFLFYRFNDLAINRASLEFGALMNLFLFGLLCNWVFFVFGNIAPAVAMHAAWNIPRMDAYFYDPATKLQMSEGSIFNVLEASRYLSLMIFFTFVLIAAYRRFYSLKAASLPL